MSDLIKAALEFLLIILDGNKKILIILSMVIIMVFIIYFIFKNQFIN